jgi:hypothetical protein
MDGSENRKKKLINALNAVIKSGGPKKITLYATICSQEIRLITSPLKLEGKIAGWIVVMEDTGDG